MRISDWSSDVCSSDLTTGRPAYSQFDVAMTGDGRFVITWIDRINILGISALKQQTLDAQRYASDGSPIGSVITVYQTDLFAVRTPTVADDGAGNFVVAWFIGPGSIWARRYDAAGRAQGVSFRVSPANPQIRSEEHTSELPSLMRLSYAVFR